MNKEYVTRVAGPPGTGKTTWLLNKIDELLTAGVQPEDIVFTTFTKAGVQEALNRACDRFKFPPSRFHGFRTLHSLCYQNSPDKGSVMLPSDWVALARTLGISFSVRFSSEEFIPVGQTRGDFLLALHSLGRVRGIFDLRHQFEQRHLIHAGHKDVSFAEFEHFVMSIQAYKTDHGKIDFTDMLEDYLQHGPDLHVPFVIVDEAQDLSPLQWKVVGKITRQARAVYIAGDDDQCIHEWNGADPMPFIRLECAKSIILPKSFRVPGLVHDLGQRIIWRVKDRLEKQYDPRAEPGTITRLKDPFPLDMRQGTWLMLARNNAYLGNYAEMCRSKGLLFTSTFGAGIQPGMKVAIDTWKALQQGRAVLKSEVDSLYNWMSARDRIAWGSKGRLKELPNKPQNYETLKNEAGLLCPKNLAWPEALDRIPPDIRAYLKLVDKREGLDSRPRIHITTIHGAKGGEADNVIVMPDMTNRTHESFMLKADPEHRVFYVAVTRARSNLYLLQPHDIKAYPL
jgi:DNA helicase-2/ATP-dependent DNA helicase PcrA